MEKSFEERLTMIHDLIRECFGDAVIAKISVTNGGMEADINFRTEINGYTMRKINGDLVKSVTLGKRNT